LVLIREDLLSFDLEIVLTMMMMMMMMMNADAKSRHGCMFFGMHLPCGYCSWFVHHLFGNSKHCKEQQASPTIHSPTTSRKHLGHHDR